MFSRVSSSLRSTGARTMAQRAFQRRNMGGGHGGYMETNKFGENLGEVVGTIAWLWVFHRFSQDGAVLLGLQHPWEHGHAGGHGDAHGHGHASASQKETMATWERFSERSTIPGEDDDDDDDDEEDDE
eukprot:Nitzschia sp. Nitz4//scaffold75_size92586//36483//37060//NITZ4_004851-RA/size92586-processed-gene-0.20-mRNA-1//1//CDS//3329557693//7212//frame0